MAGPADVATAPLGLRDLPGWGDDDLDAARLAFRLNPSDPLSAAARDATDARAFFETRFTLGTPVSGHLTGYYEPEIDGAPDPSDLFPVPLHRRPPGGCDRPRAGIDTHLRGHEIVWVRDAVDRFFAQVQGSVRVRLPGGQVLRLNHAGRNGHPYRSIGRLLVSWGEMGADITADAVKDWLRADPARGRALMDENPSYVFFRTLEGDGGPITTFCCPATAGRTLAVDPGHLPLGTPVWVEADGIARLCVAQDTGSAIEGPGRADLFLGTGAAAGRAAGRLNHAARLTPLRPR